MRRFVSLWPVTLGLVLCAGCAVDSRQEETSRLVRDCVTKVEPLTTQANRLYWEATTTGRTEKFDEFKEVQLQIRRIQSDPNDFARIKACRESGRIRDARLARQVD